MVRDGAKERLLTIKTNIFANWDTSTCLSPTHIFDPPFNIIRSSHAVLDVVDLDKSREFYSRPPSASMSRIATTARCTCAAARSISITRWCCGKRQSQLATASASRSATTAISTRPPASFPRTASPTPSSISRSRVAPCSSPIRFWVSARALRVDGEAPASAAALRPLQGLPPAAARPFQRVFAGSAEHRRLLRAARLPPDRIWRGRRAERPHRRRLDASQGQCARLRHHQRQGPSPAPSSPIGCRQR